MEQPERQDEEAAGATSTGGCPGLETAMGRSMRAMAARPLKVHGKCRAQKGGAPERWQDPTLPVHVRTAILSCAATREFAGRSSHQR